MSRVKILDVRDELRAGRHPLPQILAAATELRTSERLRVIAIFEPIPLIHLLRGKGLGCESRHVGPEHWEIDFGRDLPTEGPIPKEGTMAPCCSASGMINVDARGLEPPEPIVQILSAYETLAPGGSIHALTDRRPMHLLDALAERGASADSRELPSGGWETIIQKGCGG
ncbi:MAG: DUF2249 domain-containing protein [Verrucomicrobiae bacterium]|nr:DUF2249 domain-containing protein [Verrucomicrobiae bacterium]